MIFIIILILTTLSIAGSAAFFSIYGLAQIFTGSFYPVVIMASSLEIGKLVSASYVYRYWHVIGNFMKTYLIVAILILMLITSVGIFGFLSSAYQQDILPLDEMETQIEIYQERKHEIDKLKLELNAELLRLDAQINDIPGNHSTNRRKMRESQAPDRKRIRAELTRLTSEYSQATTEHGKLRKSVIQQKVHTGPIIFIAKAFDKEVDDATKWMILLIIFAFDPLAVALTIGANIAIVERTGGKRKFSKPKPLKPEVEVNEIPLDIQQNMSIEELEKIMKNIDAKNNHSPENMLRRQLINEMIAKKKVKQNIRKRVK